MDWNKIETLRRQANISLRQLSIRIGMSQSGFKDAVLKNTLKVIKLEEVAGLFGVSPCYFFDDSTYSIVESDNIVSDKTGIYNSKATSHRLPERHIQNVNESYRKQLELKEELIRDKDKLITNQEGRIKDLKEHIDLLKEQLNNLKGTNKA